MKNMLFCLLFLMSLGCTSALADEQISGILDHRFTVYGGGQFYQVKGDFNSTKEDQPKIKVDLDDLGLEEDPVSPVFGAILNFSKRWTLRLDYFGYHDDDNSKAEFDFNFDGETIEAGASLDSSLDLDLYAFNLVYNVYRSERAQFGVGVGLHVADLDLEISAQGSVDGIFQEERAEENLTAPLPNLYLGGVYAFTPKLLLRYGGGWMSMNYKDYGGELAFANAFFEYWPFQHAGLGVGYRYVSADIEYDPGHKKEQYDIKLPGPMVYLTLGF